jgi:hypothetical protein
VGVPGPLDERAENRRLVGVGVEVDLLVGVPPVHVRRHVTGYRDHRHRVQRGRGDTGHRVHHSRPDVQEDDADPAGRPRVPVGGVGGGLLVAGDDEVDAAAPDRVQECDVRVPAGAEDVPHPIRLELGDQGLGDGHGSRAGVDNH